MPLLGGSPGDHLLPAVTRCRRDPESVDLLLAAHETSSSGGMTTDFTWGRTTRRTIMRIPNISQVAALLALVAGLSPAHALTQEELVAKIQAAGYSQVRDIKSTAEGTTAKAMKNGKEVRLVVDSGGRIKEQQD